MIVGAWSMEVTLWQQFEYYYYKFKPEIRMQSKNALAVVYAIAGMHKLCMLFGAHTYTS